MKKNWCKKAKVFVGKNGVKKSKKLCKKFTNTAVKYFDVKKQEEYRKIWRLN